MSDDRPLTDFGDDEGDSEASESDADGDGSDTAADPMTGAVDTATVTYRWQPEGAACARCDVTIKRQWRDGDVFVCPDCKAW